MLKESYKTDPTAIEMLVCEPIAKGEMIPLSEKETGLLLQMLMSKKRDWLPEKEQPFLFKVIRQRIKVCLSFTEADDSALMLLAMKAETPGKAVLLLWYIQYKLFQKGIRELTLEVLCEHCFPWGFPKEELLHQIWVDTKVESGKYGEANLVDFNSAGQSIQFKDK